MENLPLPGMPEPPSERGVEGTGRGDGDDAVTLAWAKLFDALLELDGYGIDTGTVLTVLRGYTEDWVGLRVRSRSSGS